MKKEIPATSADQHKIHGRFDVSIRGRILVSRTWGPWNLEFVHAYRKDMDRKVRSLAGRPWAMLALTGGEPIHTPESLAEMVHTIRHHRTLGRCGTAIVMVNVDATNLIRLMLSSMYAQAGEPCFFPDDEASAIAWLEARIAEAKNP